MLKQDKNKLFEVVKFLEFSLSDIETYTAIEQDPRSIAYEIPLRSCFVIKIKNAPLEFWVWNNPNNYRQYEVKMSQLRDEYKLSDWMNFLTLDEVLVHRISTKKAQLYLDIDDVCTAFRQWLSSVVHTVLSEEEVPDLWAQFETTKSFLSSTAFSQEDIEFFNSNEKEQIRKSLNEFRRLLLENIQTTNEQKKFIGERLDYLGTAVDRLNRFDWKGLAFSVVLGVVTNLAVDTNTGKFIFNLFEQAFQSVIKLLN